MRRFSLFASLAVLGMAGQSAAAAQVTTVHRKAVSNPAGEGWNLATPTGAQFSAQLPCPFNDASVTGVDPSSPVIASRMVACRLSERMQFSAMQMEYGDSKSAREQFEKVERTMGVPRLKQSPYGTYPTIAARTKLNQLDGETRAVLVGAKILFLVAEWRPSEEANVRRFLPRFFGSLRVKANE